MANAIEPRPRAFLSERRKRSCFFLSWSLLRFTGTSLLPVLLMLLGAVTGVHGNAVRLPPPQPVLAPPSLQYGAANRAQGEENPVQEEGNPCRDYDRGQEPQLLYTGELFARMLSMDEATTGPAVDRESWERITATCSLDLPGESHTLAFNTSWLGENDNITMAKVLVVTSASSGKNGCQPQLKKTRSQSTKLPCENKPFKIRRLATVDVTTLLKQQMGQSQFHVYVKRMRHVVAAALVVFNDLNPDLFKDTDSKRCRNSATALPAAATIGMCSRNKEIWTHMSAQQQQNIRDERETPRENSEFRGRAGEESSISTEGIRKKRMSRPESNSYFDNNAARPKRNEGSAFQTPAHLHRYLNDRRRRNVHLSGELESVTRAPGGCRVESFEVHPYLDLNLDGIVSPQLLEIGKCMGQCPPIVQPSSRVPTYSHIISLLHTLHPNDPWPMPPPGCQPTGFQSFSVMRFVEADLVMERWHDARVIDCTCL